MSDCLPHFVNLLYLLGLGVKSEATGALNLLLLIAKYWL